MGLRGSLGLIISFVLTGAEFGALITRDFVVSFMGSNILRGWPNLIKHVFREVDYDSRSKKNSPVLH